MASSSTSENVRHEEDTEDEEEEKEKESMADSTMAIKDICASLIEQANHVQAFRGRWILISSKLHSLSENLDYLRTNTSEKTSLKDELPSILGSLEEAKTLVQKSIDLSYSGKLLMQSNLDALATKLDIHIKNFGALINKIKQQQERQTLAMANTRKPNPSRYQMLKEQVWDLFTKLRLGNTDLKKSTLNALAKFLEEHPKVGPGLVAKEGDLHRLVHMLDSSLDVIREKATHVVSILAAADAECKQRLMSEAVLPPLVRVLESGSPFGRERSAVALAELTSVSENAHSVACYGAVPFLVKVCRNGTKSGSIAAARTLANIARNEHLRHVVADSGAIEAVIGLIASECEAAHPQAIETLKNLTAGKDDRILTKIARHGGIQAMFMVLKNRSTSTGTQEAVLLILRDLSSSHVIARALVTAGYVSILMEFLKSGSSKLQQLAAITMYNLSPYIDFSKHLAAADSGCISSLTKMLEAKDSSQQEVAAQALSTLLLVNSNRKEFCKEEKGILRLVQLLDPRNQSIGKRFPISALMALSRSRTCRKRILCAGARPHLETLAQMNVAGAKTTLDKIGDKGILSILFKHRS